MASAFTHAIASLAIGTVSKLSPKLKVEPASIDWQFWLLGMFCAAIPDADALGFKLGVPYESMWGHRV
jgi:inner membrane protein